MAKKKKVETTSAVLLISCPDQQGIVATLTQWVSINNGNIIHLDQHVDFTTNTFFMRIEWELDGFAIPRDALARAFEPMAERFEMTWQLHFSDQVERMAVLVSKQLHCLSEVLARHRAGEWDVEFPVIISNHPDAGEVAGELGIEFHHIPAEGDDRAAHEAKVLEVLEKHRVDLVVLARYMRVLTPDFVSRYPNRMINIHHSFLPAFPGARPYHQAYSRGVKIIGATSHYVTSELDGGPIIDQDIMRVSHKDSIKEMVRKGRNLEKGVLCNALWLHLQRKILVYENKTVILN